MLDFYVPGICHLFGEGQTNLKQVNQVSLSTVSHSSHDFNSVAAPTFNVLY